MREQQRQAQTPFDARWRILVILSVVLTACLTVTARAEDFTNQQFDFDIPAQPLSSAILSFSAKTGVQIITDGADVSTLKTKGVSGQLSIGQALTRLLTGTGLQHQAVGKTAVALIRSGQSSTSATQAASAMRIAESDVPVHIDESASGQRFQLEEIVVGIPEVLVVGSKILNTDIRRTRDDPQPYVVFDRETIERAGATSLEQFLQQRLTVNASVANSGPRSPSSPVATSQINLRGLGTNQTLILIDGRRASGPALSSGATFGSLGQPDITGIPLTAIERIEVLPTTASGIYGGGATGGVINIIMRRDYAGMEVGLNYGNTFDADAATRQVDLVGGFNLNEGKTNVLVTANYSDANELLMGDRELAQHGRDQIWRNSPSFFLSPNFPPLGATTNIVSSNGSNLVLRDGTALNASFTSVPIGYAGPTSDGGAALVANAGSYNWELADSAQLGGSQAALFTLPTKEGGSFSVRHQFNETLQAYAELAGSDSTNLFPLNDFTRTLTIPANVPGNPFTTAIRVAVPLVGSDSAYSTVSKHRRAILGVIARGPRDWQFGMDYAWDRSTMTVDSGRGIRTATLQPAVNSGALDVLRDTNDFPLDILPFELPNRITSPFETTLKDASVRASGPIGHLPGGAPTLSALLEYRREGVPDNFTSLPTSNLAQFYPNRLQTVSSAYLELRAPIFSARNSRAGLRELELQLALRHDDYTSNTGGTLTFSGATVVPSPLPPVTRSRVTAQSLDPTIAVRWKPLDNLVVRASYGTGFLPPGLNQLVAGSPGVNQFGNDPLRGNTLAGPYTFVAGGNPDLDPEESKSWSAGIVLTPNFLSAMRLSVDYTRIEKTDNITVLGFQDLINNEALLPGRVERGPNLPGDAPGWAGPIIHIDTTPLNIARAELEAWDVQLDLTKETARFGTFDLYLLGTWQSHYRTQVLSSLPIVENVGVSKDNPLEFKVNAGLIWNRNNLRIGWSTQYFDSYLVSTGAATIATQGGDGRVPSQLYHDLFASYNFGYEGGGLSQWLAGTQIQAGVRNLFNTKPPFDAANASFGLYSQFGDPRLASYYLTLKRSF